VRAGFSGEIPAAWPFLVLERFSTLADAVDYRLTGEVEPMLL
jgi:hypothetical protein